jgi:peptide/nickel transport system permease protein
VETVFAYPGIGLLMFESLKVHDYPVLGACFLLLTGTVLLANLAADQVYRFIDPRVQRA